MEYLKLLKESYEEEKTFGECPPETPLEYLSAYIFDYTTYDRKIDNILAAKALQVCTAITDKDTFEYIKEPENYLWYILICNTSFFDNRLEWGGSIRGAWWNQNPKDALWLSSCGFWKDGKQIHASDPIKFTEETWGEFVHAMVKFVLHYQKEV